MNYLDDLPKRSDSHKTQTMAESAFISAIESNNYFKIQGQDRGDYGTDYHLEAQRQDAMTNLRIHVQVKGTADPATGRSVRVKVERTNLNYLLNQPHSLYVCYHLPTRRLLVRDVTSVHNEYEHRHPRWKQQKTITVTFSDAFDDAFQQRLSALAIAVGRSTRDRRLKWAASPPTNPPVIRAHDLPSIDIPNDIGRAQELLRRLYASGEDRIISQLFEQFHALLADKPKELDLLYMAEINLGINHLPFDSDRVRTGIQVLQDPAGREDIHVGTLLYSQGNGWFALKDYERARDCYHFALMQLNGPVWSRCAAECSKNMGSVLEALGHFDAARAFYERALQLDTDLAEAHVSLALWHRNHADDLEQALKHLDSVTPRLNSPIEFSRIRGWRLELLFRVGDNESAFREVWALLELAGRIEWIWPWCARQVATYGRRSESSAKQADRFWRAYLGVHPDDAHAQLERLLCWLHLRSEGIETDHTFIIFKKEMLKLTQREELDVAFIWDRIGHWAQYDRNWSEAASAYRRAYDLQADQYGYCLGTALNFLGHHNEALPILKREADGEQADEMSWFQLAVARAGVGDSAGAITAYQRAIELNPDYELAWFNLGGIYWNNKDAGLALETWLEACRRFPDHKEVEKLRQLLPFYFPVQEKIDS